MTRKTQDAQVPVKTSTKVRKVRVHEQRTYVNEEPIEEEFVEIEAEEIPTDPIADFLEGLDTDRQLTLHVFVHPNFLRDGKIGSRSERMFVTSFAFSADEPETYRQRVQYCYPQGGMFSMELRERGVIVKRWEEKLSPVPGYEAPAKQNGYPFPPPPTVSIRMPESQTHEAVSPLQVVRDQFGMMREMVSVMKELTPAPPVVNVGETTRNPNVDERPLGDRILEAVTLKALENKDTPIDRILDALGGGRKEPGWMETFAPVLAELAKSLAPAISMGIQAYVRNQTMQAQSVQNGQQPPAEGGTNGVPGQAPAALPPSPPMDPAERAWRITVRRLLEDCFEHVSISAVSPDGMSVIPASTNIVDLLDRFQNNEQLVAMVQVLLNADPAEVVDLCAMLQTDETSFNQVTKLKEAPPALVWLKELQEETKKTLAEGSEGGEDAPTE